MAGMLVKGWRKGGDGWEIMKIERKTDAHLHHPCRRPCHPRPHCHPCPHCRRPCPRCCCHHSRPCCCPHRRICRVVSPSSHLSCPRLHVPVASVFIAPSCPSLSPRHFVSSSSHCLVTLSSHCHVISPGALSLSSYPSLSALSYPSTSLCRVVAVLCCHHVVIGALSRLFLTWSPRPRLVLIAVSCCQFVALWFRRCVASWFRHVTSSARFEPVTWTCGVSGGSCGVGDLPGVPPLILRGIGDAPSCGRFVVVVVVVEK